MTHILKTRKAKIGKKNLIQKNEFWAEQNTRAGAKQMGPCRASDDRGDDLGGKRGPQPPTDHIVYMKVKVISWKNDLSYTQGSPKQRYFLNCWTWHWSWLNLGGKTPTTNRSHRIHEVEQKPKCLCVYHILTYHIIIIMYIKHHIYCIFDILYVLYIIHKMELKANHILGGRRGPHHQQITSWKKFLYVPCMYNLT